MTQNVAHYPYCLQKHTSLREPKKFRWSRKIVC